MLTNTSCSREDNTTRKNKSYFKTALSPCLTVMLSFITETPLFAGTPAGTRKNSFSPRTSRHLPGAGIHAYIPMMVTMILSPSVTAQLRGKSNLKPSNSIPPVARINRGVAIVPPPSPQRFYVKWMLSLSQDAAVCPPSLRVPVSACRLGETEES